MDLGLTGRHAIICASSRGLGRACAESLAREGCHVVINGRDEASLAETAQALAGVGTGTVEAVQADINTAEGRSALLAACPEPDILVNNNAGPPPGAFADWDEAAWQSALDANLLAPTFMIQAVIEGMKARKFGRIINITSAMVKSPHPAMGLSTAARSGLTALCKGLSNEAVAHNVTINNLLPERFDTDRQKFMAKVLMDTQGLTLEQAREAIADTINAKRFGQPEEFGDACAYLCSAQAGFISGQNLQLDGGSMRALSNRLAIGLLLVSALHAQATERPNIIVILADDLGWNDVGYHGSEIRTPNLDALADGGVTLTRFYSQPTCTPTRAALMTGKAPQRLGIYRQFAKYATHGLPTNEQTFADHLRDAGYQTWLVGKWHLGHAEEKYHPNARGFDHFYGHVTGGIGYWDHVHGGGLDWQRNGTTVRESGYATHLLAAEADQLIRNRNASKPFFLYASFNAPHLPNEAPETSVRAYEDIDNPFRQVHAAMVGELDNAIGQLVRTLEETGLRSNTLIWFLSDNGGLNRDAMPPGLVSMSETLQDWIDPPLPITMLEFIRTNALEGGADNTPLRAGKGSVYEGGARVPSLVNWPGVLAPHQSDTMITVQDVLPTVLEASGLAVPPALNGASVWGTLLDKATHTPPDYVTMGQNGEQGYYRWPWKLIAIDDEYELYNIHQDPLETSDLASAQPERVQTLTQALDAFERAENLHIPIYKVFWDPDFFGGEEDREPWADIMRSSE